MVGVTIPCGICTAFIGLGAETCPGCGRPVTSQDRATLQVRLEGGNFQAHERGAKVRKAAKWVGFLAILYALGAPLSYFTQKANADKVLSSLAELADDQPLAPIEGKTYTAGELRAKLREEVQLSPLGFLLVSALMGGLWFWARRSPLPAIGCALGLYVVLIVLDLAIDPAAILQGILIKILALFALVKGLQAALVARAAMKLPGA